MNSVTPICSLRNIKSAEELHFLILCNYYFSQREIDFDIFSYHYTLDVDDAIGFSNSIVLSSPFSCSFYPPFSYGGSFYFDLDSLPLDKCLFPLSVDTRYNFSYRPFSKSFPEKGNLVCVLFSIDNFTANNGLIFEKFKSCLDSYFIVPISADVSNGGVLQYVIIGVCNQDFNSSFVPFSDFYLNESYNSLISFFDFDEAFSFYSKFYLN